MVYGAIAEVTYQKVLHHLLARGGEFAEIFLEDRYAESISSKNGQVDRISSGLLIGAGLRLIRNGTTLFAHSEDITEEGLIRTAKALSSLSSQVSDGRVISFTNRNIGTKSQVVKCPRDVDHGVKVNFLQSAEAACYEVSPLILHTSAFYGNIHQKIVVANSDGVYAEDDRCRVRFRFQALAKTGQRMHAGTASPGALQGLEFLEQTDLKAQARAAGEQAVRMLQAKQAPTGSMPVILSNGFGGVLFHEACGHGLEADYVQRGSSVYAGQMGKRVASPLVTLVDDATLDGVWGSYAVDDEGTASRRNVLIEEGKLNSYLHDNRSAKRANLQSTGNGRRESYKHLPYPRMSNTFLLPGQSSVEEMIASTPLGFYAKDLGGGSVNPATGTFVFTVREGYLIEKGRIAHPVQGATLIGNGPEVLQNIEMVGHDGKLDAASCGKESQNVWVTVGQPSIKVSAITIGGTKLEGETRFD